MKRAGVIGLSLLGLGIATFLFMGQGAGYYGVGSVAQQVFAAQTSATTSAIVKNVGQSAHWLQYCTTSATLIDIRLEASFDATTWFPITDDARNVKNGSCQVVEAGGYYPNVRANLIAITGGGASVNAFYYGAISPISGAGSGNLVSRNIRAQSSLEANSLSLGSAFSGDTTTTNPTNTTTLIALFNSTAGAGTKTAFLDKAVISCTANCGFSVTDITAAGTGCTGVTPNNLNGGSTIASVLTVQTACTGAPTAGAALFRNIVAAQNVPFVLDLRGFTVPAAGQGIEFTLVTGITGQASVSIFWYEQ